MQICKKMKLFVFGLILIGSCKPAGIDSQSDTNSLNPLLDEENPIDEKPQVTEESLKVSIDADIPIPEDSFVFEFLDNNCSECHGYDESGKPNDFHVSWPMAQNRLTKEDLEVSSLSATAYQSLFHKILHKRP